MGKIIETQELYKYTINEITKDEDTWISFLKTASWNFKYNFEDQILIYAQRPNATACAEMKIWNEKCKRWVNKNAKIILVSTKNKYSRYPFRIVFDVSDTHNFKNTPYKLWEVKEEYKTEVIESLENRFGEITDKQNLVNAIALSVNNMVQDNMQDYLLSIEKYKTGSLLENLSKNEIETQLYKVVFNSVTYMILNRCGLKSNMHIAKSEFSEIKNFNNKDIITIIGTAISDIAEMGLREIAKTITNLKNKEEKLNRTFVENDKKEYSNNEKNIKGGNEDDRDRIQETGRLPSTKYNNEKSDFTNWKIRKNEVELSKTEQESRIYDTKNGQQVRETFIRDTGNFDKNDKADNRENGSTGWNNRKIERNRPDEMDKINEQLQNDSRGTDNERINLQLNLPTENEQKQNIAETENVSVFSFTQEMIDSVLQEGSHFENGKFRIYEQLIKSLSSQENAEFLKKEYGIGGRSQDNNGVMEEHNSKGIVLSFANNENIPKLRLNWLQVEKRIRELINADRYLSQLEKDEYNDWTDANERPKINIEIENNIKDEEYLLAKRLHSFIKDYDLYAYMDNVPLENTDEDNIELIRADINDELNIRDYIDFLKSSYENVDYDDELTVEARCLLKELEKRLPYYEYNVGDIVYIGTKEYSIIEIEKDRVLVTDTKFPILVEEFDRKQFDKRILENPSNDKLRTKKKVKDILENIPIKDIEKNYLSEKQQEIQENNTVQINSRKEVKQTEKKLVQNIKRKRRNKIEYFDLHPEIPLKERNNYQIIDNALGEGTKKEKYHRNVEAIRVLKRCEDENRYATQEEQEILAQYVGWGGIADAFDADKDEWSKEYKELKSILTEKEYEEARKSTLTSFYTPPIVIESIYKALEKMGLKQGNILEPSCRCR